MTDTRNGRDTVVPAPDGNDRLNIAMVTDAGTLSSYSAILRQFFIGLSDEANLAIVSPAQAEIDFLSSLPVEIISHPAIRLPLLWRQNRARLLSRLEQFKPCALHCFGYRKMALTIKLAKHFDIAAVVTLDSLPQGLLKFMPSLSAFNHIVALSDKVAKNITEAHPSVKALVRQVNMGTFVENNCACFPKSDRNPSIVVVHPLNRLADFELLLCAARHLAIDGYEFVLAIIGSGKAEKTIRKTIEKLGLGRIINITNEFHPLRTVFCGADIFIQPQPGRLFPAPLLEAMSTGTAIAACDNSESDLLIENQTALLFDPDDELSIYATVKKLLDEHETARRLAANAQYLIRRNHTVSRMVSDMFEIYHKAATPAGTSVPPVVTTD